MGNDSVCGSEIFHTSYFFDSKMKIILGMFELMPHCNIHTYCSRKGDQSCF